MSLPQGFIDLVQRADYASYRQAANDTGLAALLNEKTERGPIPISELASYCVRNGLTGKFELAAVKEANPDDLRSLCFNVLTILRDDYRLTTADMDDAGMTAALDGLVAAELITSTHKTTLLALGANRRGKAEVELGRPCTPQDVAQAR